MLARVPTNSPGNTMTNDLILNTLLCMALVACSVWAIMESHYRIEKKNLDRMARARPHAKSFHVAAPLASDGIHDVLVAESLPTGQHLAVLRSNIGDDALYTFVIHTSSGVRNHYGFARVSPKAPAILDLGTTNYPTVHNGKKLPAQTLRLEVIDADPATPEPKRLTASGGMWRSGS